MVLVADERRVLERIPFGSRRQAEKFIRVVRSRGLRVWLEGDDEPATARDAPVPRGRR